MAGRKRAIADGLIYFLNILSALGLLGAYLAYYVSPELTSLFAFAALAYPVLLLLNLIFVIYWLLRLKLKIMLSVICILIGYQHTSRLHQFSGSNKVVNPASKLKVMTYNVRMFNYYEWIDQKGIPDAIRKTVEDEDPDVLMIQEYYADSDPGLDYPYKTTKLTNYGKNYGLVIFSKFPIEDSGTIKYTDQGIENDDFHYADIKWGKKKLRFINIHLASVGLGREDYKLLQNAEDADPDVRNGLITISKRLHWAFKRRAQQIGAVAKAIEDSPYPVVLTGDFNDVPSSYTYHQIDLLLDDSFLESGRGFGKTYVSSPVPLRIDYIFHSEELRAFDNRVVREKLSDHYPVVAEIELK